MSDAIHEARQRAREERDARLPEGWTCEPAYVGWAAVHRDYDASTDGPEGEWIDNGLMATAPDFDALLIEIACIEEEHLHFQDRLPALAEVIE